MTMKPQKKKKKKKKKSQIFVQGFIFCLRISRDFGFWISYFWGKRKYAFSSKEHHLTLAISDAKIHRFISWIFILETEICFFIDIP